MLPTIWKEPLSSEPWPGTRANEWVSPGSGSPAERVPTVVPTGWFSATLVGRERDSRSAPAILRRRRGGGAPADDVLTARVDDVDGIDERRVIPAAADHAVDGTRLRRAPRRRRALAGVEPVVAVGADQHVTAALAEKTILAPAAEQPVRAAVAGEHVVAAPALDALDVGLDVVALTGDAVVRPGADRHDHRYTALAIDHDVATRPTGHAVGPEAAAEDVVTRAAAHVVGAGATEGPVITRTTVEPVGARLALQQIAAATTEHHVVPAVPAETVSPAEAAHDVTAPRPVEPVRAPVAGHGAGLRRDSLVDQPRSGRRRGDQDEQQRSEAEERTRPRTTRRLLRRDGV